MISQVKAISFILLSILYVFQFNIYGEEKLFCNLDGRNWKIGYTDSNEDQTIIEMVLDDESILDWQELFTVQTFKGLDISAEEFAKGLEAANKEKILAKVNDKIRFNWIEPKNLNIIENSFIHKNTNSTTNDISQDEYNLGRILKGKDTIYYIRYSTKDKNTYEQNKEKWKKKLTEAYLAEVPNDNRAGHWFSFVGDKVYEGDQELNYEVETGTIADEKAKFSISLPVDWLVNDKWIEQTTPDAKSHENIVLVFSSPNKKIYGGIAFSDIKQSSSKDLALTARKNFWEAYKEQVPNAKLLKEGTVQTTLGDDGFYAIIKDGEEIAWISFFVSQEYLYRLEVWTQKANFNNSKAVMQQILTNFHIQGTPEEIETKKREEVEVN